MKGWVIVGKYRLVTRSDFDGLVCAVLLRDLDIIGDIKFVHPKDMQDGIIEISENDITTNLPYVESAHLVFDHHLSETIRNPGEKKNYIIDPKAPSAARVVYDYYGGKEKFKNISEEMMDAVDKADSAQFTRDEIIEPKGWVLLNFLMDARTGLGRFREFRISNYDLMMNLIEYCKNHDINDILQLPDVKERVELYSKYKDDFSKQLKNCAKVHDNVVVIDLKDEDIIYPGNRFMKYVLWPETNISIQVIWGFKKQNTVLTVGKSIVNRSSKVNIGELMLEYGGGGHANAGTCQLENDKYQPQLETIIKRIQD